MGAGCGRPGFESASLGKSIQWQLNTSTLHLPTPLDLAAGVSGGLGWSILSAARGVALTFWSRVRDSEAAQGREKQMSNQEADGWGQLEAMLGRPSAELEGARHCPVPLSYLQRTL